MSKIKGKYSRRQHLIGAICGLILAGLLPASAQTTWHVAMPPAGNDDGSYDGLSWLQPFATISNAVSKASDEHVILVSNGEYAVTAHVDVTNGVHIRSWNQGSLDRDGTIINGGGASRCFYLRDDDAILQGLTITNGYPTNTSLSGYGGGVYCTAGRLLECNVSGNHAGLGAIYGGRGAGIYLNTTSLGLISNCLISGNLCEGLSSAGAGGGVYLNGGIMVDSTACYNRVITANSGNDYGGGVQLAGNASMSGCVVFSNEAGWGGGGVWASGANNVISNIMVHGNMTQGVSLAANGALRAYDVTVSNNHAGGVFAGGNNSSLEIFDSKIVNNTGCDLGALLVRGWGLVSNCDISYNTLSIGRGSVNFYRTASVGPGSGTVTHSRVVGNILVGNGVDDAYGAGMRVAVNSYGVLVDHCEIRDNIATNSRTAYGGGVNISSNVVLRNTLVCGNWAFGTHPDAGAGGVGAGIYISNGASNRVESCTIADNHAKIAGGGIYIKGSGADTIINSVVASNKIGDGTLYDNWHFEVPDRRTNVFYTCTPEADGTWGTGCIGADPQFADPDAGNYRLLSDSPGMHAGTNLAWMKGAYDLDGRPRLDRFTRLADMGCYEFVPQGVIYYLH